MQMGSTEFTDNSDRFVRFGDVYDAIEACEQLDILLGRLKRQRLVPDEHCSEGREQVQTIRQRLLEHIHSHDLVPKGPRLR